MTTSTSGIADDDGLTNVSYSYQWIRNDGSTDTDIQAATGSTHTLVDADEGKTIKVKVIFTDDADNEESLTSTATDEVAAGAPTDPAGSPRNLTYTATYTAVTLSWDDPADDSITGYQILRRNRQDAGDHLGVLVDDTGGARQTYTDKDLEPRAEYEYQVKAGNEHGLSLASNSVSVDVPADPDATRETAIDLGDITGFTSLHGTSGSVNNRSDQQDYYKFRVSESRIIYVKLGHLDVDAGLYLEDPQGKKLKIRDSSWTSERWFETPVERGTYFILVKAAEDGDNSYTLRYQVKNQTDDYARWTNTNGSVAFNGSSTGSIDFTGDRDWFAADLTAGQTYVFMHQGSPTDHGTLTDTAITGIFDTDGQPIRWTSDDDSGIGTNAKVVFTPTETGTYYIEASAHKRFDWDGPPVGPGAEGTYTIFLSEYTSHDSDDYSNFTDTTGAIEVGSSVQAEIETVGDQDWFAVDLTANRSYLFAVTSDLETSDQRRLMRGEIYGIYDDDGNAVSDPVDEQRAKRWEFRPSNSGKYFVSIGGDELFNSWGETTGIYQLTVTEEED